MTSEVVLRRNSWMVICWSIILGLGVGMVAAVFKVTSVNGFRVGWQGIPVYLAFVGIIGRVVSCKVILHRDTLIVVNPLRTHIIPAAVIHDVAVGDDGTLEVRLDNDRVVSVFAFGGSLIDRFINSSEETARKISGWLSSTEEGRGLQKIAPEVRWTLCPSADASLVLCIALSATGAAWMAFTSN
ncbi:PH domain-containing protein [Streptomyces sp. ADI93-02]|uniref:PH domain-containing protein n=1 Tax=Streptomyces sp. ADI93-02 TaxID=1522757 RepID=UPI000F55272A|nr:PH domain-containing protein [Streptomyces sp. ADI93-02]